MEGAVACGEFGEDPLVEETGRALFAWAETSVGARTMNSASAHAVFLSSNSPRFCKPGKRAGINKVAVTCPNSVGRDLSRRPQRSRLASLCCLD